MTDIDKLEKREWYILIDTKMFTTIRTMLIFYIYVFHNILRVWM